MSSNLQRWKKKWYIVFVWLTISIINVLFKLLKCVMAPSFQGSEEKKGISFGKFRITIFLHCNLAETLWNFLYGERRSHFTSSVCQCKSANNFGSWFLVQLFRQCWRNRLEWEFVNNSEKMFLIEKKVLLYHTNNWISHFQQPFECWKVIIFSNCTFDIVLFLWGRKIVKWAETYLIN